MVAVRGQRLTVARHLVIATRINPNAVNQRTRRIQIRAWNNNTEVEESGLASAAAVEIVAAHLFGLFRGLGLPEYARAIAVSSQVRAESRDRHPTDADRRAIRQRLELAESELGRRARRPVETPDAPVDAQIPIDTEFGPIEVDLSMPLMTLARNLCVAETSEAADEVVRVADSQLNAWEPSRRSATHELRRVVLPFGVELRVPPEFEHRR
jgi:hypothetical protein